MKYELIWGIHRGITRDHLNVRAQSAPPPCSIGLTSTSGAQALPTTSEDANFEDNPDNYENDVESKFNFLQTGQKPSIFCFHEKNIPIVNH